MGYLRASALAVASFTATIACSTTDPTVDNAAELEGIQRCSNDDDCDGATCCDGRCEDISLSMRACGTCGNTCDGGTFCTGTACEAFSFNALCGNAEILVVHREGKFVDGEQDDPTPDNDAGDAIEDAFADLCNNTTPAAAVIAEADVLEGENEGPLTTGRGTLLIVGGGRVFSSVIDYLDDVDVTPVELVLGADGDAFQLVIRSQRRVIAADRLTQLSANRDYIIGQAIYDATSGTQILNVYGIFRGGTSAGAQYFTTLAAQAATAGERWFVAKTEGGTVTRLAGE